MLDAAGLASSSAFSFPAMFGTQMRSILLEFANLLMVSQQSRVIADLNETAK